MQASRFDPRTASLTNLTTYLEKQVGKNISEKAGKKKKNRNVAEQTGRIYRFCTACN